MKRILWVFIKSRVKTHVSCLPDSSTTQVAKMERLKSHLGNCGASVTGQSSGREKEGRKILSELNLSLSVSLHLVVKDAQCSLSCPLQSCYVKWHKYFAKIIFQCRSTLISSSHFWGDWFHSTTVTLTMLRSTQYPANITQLSISTSLRWSSPFRPEVRILDPSRTSVLLGRQTLPPRRLGSRVKVDVYLVAHKTHFAGLWPS